MRRYWRFLQVKLIEKDPEPSSGDRKRRTGRFMKLKPFTLGASLGIVWGGALFLMTWLSVFTGYSRLFLEALPQSIYPGYSITPAGSIIGLLYGFVDGLVSGALIAWIYNRIAKT